MCSVCRNHNPVRSSFMTYHRVCNKRITTGATCGAGTVSLLTEHLSSPTVLSGVRVVRSVVFCVVFCTSLFALLIIVLSVFLRFTASDNPFDNFKLLFSLLSGIVLLIRISHPTIHFPLTM